MVTLAKRGDLHARRQALSIMMEKDVVHKLFEEASDRFGSINGGYTRLVKLGTRPGDAASVTLVELVSLEKKQKKKAKKKTTTEEVKKTPEPETEQEPESRFVSFKVPRIPNHAFRPGCEATNHRSIPFGNSYSPHSPPGDDYRCLYNPLKLKS